jgi:indolepyruvate ferredoxin oxidoreductase beta subunit
MKKDIILAGVGGQGILTIAAAIGLAAVEAGMFLKQAEVHGMSQRGGDVQSNLRFADKEVASDLIPFGQADMIISVEPMESLRYLPMLHKDGWVITNTQTFVNIPNYPAKEDLMAEIGKIEKHVAMDAEHMAKELGSVRAANMVILGAATPFLGLDYGLLENALKTLFGKKGEKVLNLNLAAMKAGYGLAMKKVNS